MRGAARTAGHTLIEIVVAIVIFSVGALALATSSALVARSMARNALRDRVARVAVTRIEILKSQCAIASSGKETVEQLESDWTVSREQSRISVVESVRCLVAREPCAVTYRTLLWCRP